MKSFQFRLEQVLEWRRRQLELEEARFQEKLAAMVALDRARAQLEAAAMRAEAQVRKWSPLAGNDLNALASFQRHTSRQEKAIALGRTEARRELESQQEIMLEARRRCRLLERLRQRRLTEWQLACDRELEELASETYLAGLARRQD